MAGVKSFTVFTKFAVKNGFSGPVLAMAKGADKMAARADKAAKTMKAFGQGAAKVGKFVGGVALGAAAAGAAVFKLAEGSARAADDILNTANALGLSTKALQEYRYVGIQAGLTTEEMDSALTKLTKNLGNGSGEVENALYQIGVSAEQLKAAGPDKSLELIAEGFRNVKDPQTKAAVAMTLFGKASVRMVNALDKGAAGIAGFRAEAEEVGYVMDDTALEKAGALDDALDKLGATATGAGNRFAAKLIPGVMKLTQGLQKGLQPGGALSKIIDKLASFGGSIGGGLGPAFDKVLEFVPKLIGYAEGLWNALKPVVEPVLSMIEPVLKIVDNLMPAVIKAVEFAAKILEPFLAAIKAILDGLAYITGEHVAVAQRGAGTTTSPSRPGSGAPRTSPGAGVPMSPASSVMSTTTTNKSEVAITVGNLPPGSTVKQDKPAPGITVNTGQTVDWAPKKTRFGGTR